MIKRKKKKKKKNLDDCIYLNDVSIFSYLTFTTLVGAYINNLLILKVFTGVAKHLAKWFSILNNLK